MSIKTEPAEQTILVDDTSMEQEHPQTLSRRSQFANIWSHVILPFLVIRLLLVVVGVVTVYYLLPLLNLQQPVHPDLRIKNFPDMLWLLWNHFDSGFYLSIAHDGYWGPETLHSMSNWAFFPLYPVLIHLFALPFGSSYDTYQLAGIVVANVAAVIAAIYLYKLTTRELSSAIAARTVLYLALFPMSFYFSAIYPESLFLALTISCVYYARLRRWWLAGLLGGFAALTRPQGVLLVVVVGWEYWQYLADKYAPLQHPHGLSSIVRDWLHSRLWGLWRALSSVRTWPGFGALLLIPMGLSIFCIYGWFKVNTFFPFEEVERYGWGRTLTNPLWFVIHMFHHPLEPSPYDWNFYALNMLVIGAFWLALIAIFRKLPWTYGVLAFLFLLMPLTSGETNSIARYYMEIFPTFMVLALWTSKGTAEQQLQRHTLVVIGFSMLLALGMVMFTLGVYAMS